MKSKLVILFFSVWLLSEAGNQTSIYAQGWGYPCGPDGAPLLQMLTPQGFMGADFRGSCYQHDRCYEIPGISRRYCDLQLRQELHRRCDYSAFPLGCRMVSNFMYLQVRLYGRRPYLNSQYPRYLAPVPVYSQPVYYGY